MNATIKNYFNDISMGMTAQYEKQVTDEDVRTFARISGDYNPIHLDEEHEIHFYLLKVAKV